MRNKAQKLEYIEALKERLKRESRSDLLRFTHSTMRNFKPTDFHRKYYSILGEFASGKYKKMMVFMPPQHGKSEGSTRRLPAFMLGQNPDLRIAIISYSAPKARKFNRELQRIIDSEDYAEIFPNTTMSRQSNSRDNSGYVRNADEFEIVGRSGSLKSVGVGGPLTGDPVDILIMDDLYKDAKSAWSPIVRESIRDWYDSVAETRLHNDSRQLIVFTRWHEQDLAGTLLQQQGEYDEKLNPNGWKVVSFKAIKEGEPTDYDTRQDGEALWPERHSLESLIEIRKRNPQVFESLYQQDPKPKEGLMYNNLRTYEELPAECIHGRRKNYTDTADTGADALCSVCYIETATGMYITDVEYTDKPMEYTEPATARMLTKNRTEEARIESNNGGRGFARAVERECRLLGNTKTSFVWFSQTQNKEVRIFSHSAEVQNLIYFPQGWEYIWPQFYAAVTSHRKEGRNAHDDAPDVLTGMVEYFSGGNGSVMSDEEESELEDMIY